MSENRYYISSGRLNGFYTLRVEFSEPTYYKSEFGTFDTGITARDHYIMTLTRNPETSLAKAEKYLAEVTPNARLERPDFSLGDIHKSTDWTVFHSGKHIGKSAEWVLQNDPEYALWAAENLGGDKYSKTVAILQEVLAPILQDRALKRELAVVSQEEKKALRIAMLKPLADRLRDGKNGFCDSIANDMEKGHVPSGRGLSITLDILCKQAGRRNSKAYDAEMDSIGPIFDQVQEIN